MRCRISAPITLIIRVLLLSPVEITFPLIPCNVFAVLAFLLEAILACKSWTIDLALTFGKGAFRLPGTSLILSELTSDVVPLNVVVSDSSSWTGGKAGVVSLGSRKSGIAAALCGFAFFPTGGVTSCPKNGIVIDSHLSHYLSKKFVDLCIVTKCNLTNITRYKLQTP